MFDFRNIWLIDKSSSEDTWYYKISTKNRTVPAYIGYNEVLVAEVGGGGYKGLKDQLINVPVQSLATL